MPMTKQRTHKSAAGGTPVDRPVKPDATEASWCVVSAETGLTEAKGYAPTAAEAVREAGHCAAQYAMDGPVTWWVRQGRKTVCRGWLAGSAPPIFTASRITDKA